MNSAVHLFEQCAPRIYELCAAGVLIVHENGFFDAITLQPMDAAALVSLLDPEWDFCDATRPAD